MLLLWLWGFAIDVTMIALLMGMSIIGIMYFFERVFSEKKWRHFWFVRIILVLGGIYMVYATLSAEWGILLFISLLTFFLILIPTLFFQGITHEEVVKENKTFTSSVIKKLDNCC